MIAAL